MLMVGCSSTCCFPMSSSSSSSQFPFLHIYIYISGVYIQIRVGVALPFFWLGTIGFLIVVIENQQENRIVKQWVQPPINKNRLPPGCFFIRVPSYKFYFLFLRCSLEYYGKASKSSCWQYLMQILIRDSMKFEIKFLFL